MRWSDYAALRSRVLVRDRFKCWNCGEHASDVDHKWPVALGGPTTEDNLRASCKHCNAKKYITTHGWYPGQNEHECVHCHLGEQIEGNRRGLCRACLAYLYRKKILPPEEVLGRRLDRFVGATNYQGAFWLRNAIIGGNHRGTSSGRGRRAG